MKRFRYSESEHKLIEGLAVPVAVYQFIDRRVVTIALSKGFCELFGFDDPAEAYYVMDHDMYRDAHPDDVARIEDIAVDFAVNGGEYEAIYRNKSPKDEDYRVIHSKGKHIYKETGERLAIIWYTDEGMYDNDIDTHLSRLNRILRDGIHRDSLMYSNAYDNLTGLPNLSYFFQLSESGRDALLSEDRQPAMVFFDLNGMKAFNSKYGFAEGDVLLREVARLLVKYFSKESCGRFGQDKFIVYADNNGLVDKLNSFFEELRTINGGRTLTVKAGIFLKVRGVDLDAGVAADRAKAAANSIEDTTVSAYRYFDDEMLARIDHEQYIIDRFERALEEGWIQVYYQPIVRAANGCVCDEEALARWIDPEKGYMPPDEFIPILENAHLIYRLDLYVLDEILQKIKRSDDAGLYIVPQSVNLSRFDFESCDIVEEIRKRVDNAGVSHDKITIEITESVIGSDFDFMKAQVERFHALGFNVWMDDFGSDYSSLDFLQSIPFDLIKLDMRFMKQFYESEKTRVILTELVRMAMNLGLDTVTEGVEDEAQVEFLREIGCTKLQGYYFCKPIPEHQIMKRYETGEQIGFENPDESDYYEAIGRISLYDISGLGRDDQELEEYFDTLPMAIVEYDGSSLKVLRENKSFRAFKQRIAPTVTGSFLQALRKCSETGTNIVTDEIMPNGSAVHTYFKKVAENPVTGVTAVAFAVLATAGKKERTPGTTSAAVARALSADYFDIYYINIKTDDFIHYVTDRETGEILPERHGTDFFEEARKDSLRFLYKADQEEFLKVFTRENVVNALEEQGVFTHTYRLVMDGEPTYVSLKITSIGDDETHVIMGVNNIDAEMKQKEEFEKIKSERILYSRLKAITGDYIVFYTVDPVTDDYSEYFAVEDFAEFGVSKDGHDFFGNARKNGVNVVYNSDLDRYLAEFTKENVMSSIEKNGIFSMKYRLMRGGEPRYVYLTAGLAEEPDGRKLIVGINDIDSRVRDNEQHSAESGAKENATAEASRPEEEGLGFIPEHTAKPCAVISVEKKPDGEYGEIRIVCANRGYKEIMGADRYYDNMPYQELVPKEIKFERFCYRAAVLGQRMRSYVETKALDTWTDFELIPMTSDRDDIGYCQFIFEFTNGPEADRMANVSMETASMAIEACIKLLAADDLRASVSSILEDVRVISDALSCRVILVDKDSGEVSNYCVVRDDSNTEGMAKEDVHPYDVVSTWESMIDESNVVIIKNEYDMEQLEARNPVWAATLRRDKINSLIFLPLYSNRKIFGYLYMANFNTERVVEIKEMLELLSFFLGTEISNSLLMDRMESMALTDPLTGAGNRRSMARRLEEAEGRTAGFISVDLNGLKLVNDNLGHDAGDRIIERTYEVLRENFSESDIFRTGGDEFVVVIPDIKEGAFTRKMDKLMGMAHESSDISLAVGSFWNDGSESVIKSMKIADDRMYEDKEAFYREYPELRQR